MNECCTTEDKANCSKCKMMPIVIVTLLIAVAGYFGFWKYNASEIEKKIKQNTTKLEQELATIHPDAKIDFGDISITGFPTSYNIEIKNPQFSDGMTSVKLDSIKINTDLTYKNFEGIIGKDVEITNMFGGKSVSQSFKFNTSPVIKIKSNSDGIPTLISFESDGYSTLYNGKKTGTVKKLGFLYSLEQPSKNTNVLKIKADYLGVKAENLNVETYKEIIPGLSDATANKIIKLTQDMGEMNGSLDLEVSVVGPEKFTTFDEFMMQMKDGSINLKTYGFDMGGLGINISGTAKVQPQVSPMPTLDFKIKISKINKLFGFVKDSVNMMPELFDVVLQGQTLPAEKQQEIEMFKVIASSVDDNALNMVKSFLREISDEPTGNGEDVNISIKSMADGNIMVGTLDTAQFMQLMGQRFNM